MMAEVVSIWMDGLWGRIMGSNIDFEGKAQKSKNISNLTIIIPAPEHLSGTICHAHLGRARSSFDLELLDLGGSMHLDP